MNTETKPKEETFEVTEEKDGSVTGEEEIKPHGNYLGSDRSDQGVAG